VLNDASKLRILRMVYRVLQTPQNVVEQLRQRVTRLECQIDETAQLFPESAMLNFMGRKESITIGAHSRIRGECRTYNPSGRIRIGSYCYLGSHSRIWSAAQVTVGDRVAISDFVNIHDNDSHPLSCAKRHAQIEAIFYSFSSFSMDQVSMAPVVIEDDVWIGVNAMILKGVTIGRGAVIGAGSVITKDVPPFAIMAGNPGRQVGTASE